MGEILCWRLLLFHVQDHSIGDRQAKWNEQEDAVTFEGTTLRIDHVPTLLTSEYQQCRQILYDQLMLNTKDFRHMYAPAVQDRSNVETVHWSFVDWPANMELLCGANRLLLDVIAKHGFATSRNANVLALAVTRFGSTATRRTTGSQPRTNGSAGMKCGCRHSSQLPVFSDISLSTTRKPKKKPVSAKTDQVQSISITYQMYWKVGTTESRSISKSSKLPMPRSQRLD